jgi:hypothetical protein
VRALLGSTPLRSRSPGGGLSVGGWRRLRPPPLDGVAQPPPWRASRPRHGGGGARAQFSVTRLSGAVCSVRGRRRERGASSPRRSASIEAIVSVHLSTSPARWCAGAPEQRRCDIRLVSQSGGRAPGEVFPRGGAPRLRHNSRGALKTRNGCRLARPSRVPGWARGEAPAPISTLDAAQARATGESRRSRVCRPARPIVPGGSARAHSHARCRLAAAGGSGKPVAVVGARAAGQEPRGGCARKREACRAASHPRRHWRRLCGVTSSGSGRGTCGDSLILPSWHDNVHCGGVCPGKLSLSVARPPRCLP